MATIAQDVAQIRQAVYGKDVREAIADGIEKCYTDVSSGVTLANTAANNANSKATAADTAATAANTAAAAANGAAANVASAYSASSTYTVGDYVSYDNHVYRCSTDISTAEEWNSAHWTPVTVANEVSDLKSALSSEDIFVNDILSFVNYDYDTPFEQIPSSGSWASVFGIKRVLQTIILNREGTSSTTARVRISGNVALAGNNAGVQAWTNGVQLVEGHNYAARIKLLSGTSLNSGTAAIPSIFVYIVGGSSTIGAADGTESGRFNFTAPASEVNLALYISTGFTFTDAKFLVTLEDLTESRLHIIESGLEEANTDIATIQSNINDFSKNYLDLTTAARTLEDGTNIDELTPGTYKVPSASVAATMTGTPPSTAIGYRIIVSRLMQASKTIQIAFMGDLANTAQHIMYRFNTNNVWKDWQTIASTDNVQTMIDTAISESASDAIPDYYNANSYLQNKIDAINAIAISLGEHSFQSFFVTDYHTSNNARVSPRIIAKLTKETGIRNVVFGGDAITRDTDSKLGGYALVCEFLKDFRVVEQNANTYYITGNHEQNDPANSDASVRLEQYVSRRLFNSRNTHIIHSFDGTNTFYVDDSVSKIRFLCVDCNWKSTVYWQSRLAAFQAMEDVPDGYALFIFSHVASSYCSAFSATTSYSADDYVIYDNKVYKFTQAHSAGAWTGTDVQEMTSMTVDQTGKHAITGLNTQWEEIVQCAKALNDGTTFSVYHSTIINYSHDFSGHARTFIGAIAGHLHFDGYLIYDGRFPVITTTADTGAYVSSHDERVAGTITEQAFDVVQIDVDAKRIYCTRIGFGNDRVFSFGDTGAGLVT